MFECHSEGFSCNCCLEFVLMPRTYGHIVEKQLEPGQDLTDGCCHPVCCAGQFLVPCVQSFVNEVMGTLFPPLAVIGALIHLRTRHHLKEKYGIGQPGFECGELAAMFFCKCCATYQEIREIRKREGQAFNSVDQAPAPQEKHR
jgi:Cys-rich protein (TIGR01571 family)